MILKINIKLSFAMIVILIIRIYCSVKDSKVLPYLKTQATGSFWTLAYLLDTLLQAADLSFFWGGGLSQMGREREGVV